MAQVGDVTAVHSVCLELGVTDPFKAFQAVVEFMQVELLRASGCEVLQLRDGVEVAGGVDIDGVACETAVAESAYLRADEIVQVEYWSDVHHDGRAPKHLLEEIHLAGGPR